MNFDDDPEIKAYLEHAEREMLPKMKSSAMSIVLLDGEGVTIELCAEIGAAILLDKPILVVILPGAKVPANLKRVAASIVEGNPRDPAVADRLQAAISAVLDHDKRVVSVGLTQLAMRRMRNEMARQREAIMEMGRRIEIKDRFIAMLLDELEQEAARGRRD